MLQVFVLVVYTLVLHIVILVLLVNSNLNMDLRGTPFKIGY
jgi:hypothetical protein